MGETQENVSARDRFNCVSFVIYLSGDFELASHSSLLTRHIFILASKTAVKIKQESFDNMLLSELGVWTTLSEFAREDKGGCPNA